MDINSLLVTANLFVYASNLIKKERGLLIPHVVNCAFACELYLKAFLYWEGKTPEELKEHKLDELYKQLSKIAKETAEDIKTISMQKYTNSSCDFDKYLGEISNVFYEWRYAYEKQDVIIKKEDGITNINVTTPMLKVSTDFLSIFASTLNELSLKKIISPTSRFLKRFFIMYYIKEVTYGYLGNHFQNKKGRCSNLPQNCEVLDVGGVAYLRYTFASGQRAAIEFSKVGVLTQFQYGNDFFGENNAALKPTLQLIHTQNQGIINGVKNSANIRFLAKIANMISPEDIKKERNRFTEENLSAENKSGMIIYDNKFADLKQVESKPFIVNPLQMKQINENAYNYFGTNENILQIHNFSTNKTVELTIIIVLPITISINLML